MYKGQWLKNTDGRDIYIVDYPEYNEKTAKTITDIAQNIHAQMELKIAEFLKKNKLKFLLDDNV